MVLDLLEAACSAGAGIPRALDAVGRAVGGATGTSMRAAGAALVVGARWEEAWHGGPATRVVAAALRPAWEDGAPPGGGLRATAERVRRERHAAALAGAARLGVRLVLPLGLCHLPAFVLVGLVPVLVSMAAGSLG
ncbi:type II secretion system F family protein [Actinotalea sp. BY-33]|uniref:Type II secretion system F family protein n=1 Tax=Actinotalea soli TaxID=2819234 RepID=A0A939LS18_9CELL|nr:type II secretion system F family protein [Actinotalea soli]MBO1753059.1 type II secretion system F family protein [Actinotalea soli]